MEDENGVEVAKELRSFDRNCILVFTTTSTDHALDGFKVRALQYLVKPYADEELNAVFKEIIEKIPTPDKYIDVNVVGGDVRIRLCEIIFAEHFQHCIHIHTSDGQTTITRKTFSGFMIELEGDERFFMCSRGVLINLEYAKDFNGSVFTLKNGTEIPVSRSLAKSARVAFGDFLFRRGQNNARYYKSDYSIFSLHSRRIACILSNETSFANIKPKIGTHRYPSFDTFVHWLRQFMLHFKN